MQVSTSTPTIVSLSQLPAEIAHSSMTLLERIEFYEMEIAADETIISNYWHLGIAYLLADREDDAQAAWFTPLSIADPAEIDILTNELVVILEQEATNRAISSDLNRAWLIRQHLWTLAPDCVENVLKLIVISGSIGELSQAALVEWQLNELLNDAPVGSIDEELLEQIISALLAIRTDLSLDIIRSCLQLTHSNRKHQIDLVVVASFQIFHVENDGIFAIKLGEICQGVEPNNLVVLQLLVGLYLSAGWYSQSKKIAEQFYQLANGIADRLFGSYLLQRAYFTSGDFLGAIDRIANYRVLLKEIADVSPQNLQHSQRQGVIVSPFFLPYTEDNPRINKPLQNQLSSIYQENIQITDSVAEFGELSIQKKAGCLRIGYVGSTFKAHSVGWLSRWLINHHDHDSFQIFTYCINISKEDKFNHKWFRNKVDISYHFEGYPDQLIAQIKADEIDILIDLDSLTLDLTCLVMASKPAPVQVSWLGWDSSGIPAVDYFIADPYVLPDDAQDYYQEKIWRLPQTYLAVDGFEVGVPTLRREDLNIPADAVVYLCSQSGYKRHPDNIRCQMKILKAVPNSYFLIKGKSDANIIKNFFGKMAEEEGISLDRLRFLERDFDEYTHRANLAIADIVLDTFPYNGATTTLETLWMGIPMVTQVGQQFAARNSYTFMLNAGITEGIAWSEQEYIDWGIKLGLDRELRWQIKGKLHAARATAPVWNAKQFTLDMEQAYREMWAKYQESQHDDAIDLHQNN
jgi:predicted O-linked N-acetylglucosamine transferase (SPINDLY family)